MHWALHCRNQGVKVKKAFLSLFFIFLVLGCTSNTIETSNVKTSPDFFEKNSVLAVDGSKLVFFIAKSSENKKAVLLLHMLGSNKESWLGTAKKLYALGYTVMIPDLRGHGESVSGKSFQFFSNNDYAKMKTDVELLVSTLKKKTGKKTVYIFGASIGANLALIHAAKDSSVKGIALLSPGIEYRGLKTLNASKNFSGNVFLAASKGDSYAFNSSKQLFEQFNGKKVFKELNGNSHGTNMLKEQNLEKEILKWIQAIQ